MAEIAQLKAAIPCTRSRREKISRELEHALAQIPNLPLDDVPDGKDPGDNIERHHFGAKRDYGFAPKQHFELGESFRARWISRAPPDFPAHVLSS